MNSLNLLSARVIGQPSRPVRSRSLTDSLRIKKDDGASQPKRSASQHAIAFSSPAYEEYGHRQVKAEDEDAVDPTATETTDEKAPLLDEPREQQILETKSNKGKAHLIIKRVVDAVTGSIRWVLSKLVAPGVYIVTCFYTEEGRFSALAPFRRSRRRTGSRKALQGSEAATSSNAATTLSEKPSARSSKLRRQSSSSASSDSDATWEQAAPDNRSTTDSEKPRRSIRIRLSKEDAGSRKKPKKVGKASSKSSKAATLLSREEAAAAELKSPTSPASSLAGRTTTYPHAPAPPRPLIPRRQPSYSGGRGAAGARPGALPQKTLVIDLDETLIHSLAKGGRMSSGHMVEVKLAQPAQYNGVLLGPQHPILYYVHKRPHCDEFLRAVAPWYRLVVFTASVQEYADPVIDWLEQERGYFAARYYRQHCTFRNNAYIKDLNVIEPDLSRVMILDNSPLSYIFHEDNAIPIEGWINDPTDNDLLHLIPMLEALQYVVDVRAVLSLRRGEANATK